jgi:hypothetical protein
VSLSYEKQSKARRNDALARMLNLNPSAPIERGEGNAIDGISSKEMGALKMPSLKIIINNNQSGDDKRRIEMTGDKTNYTEN